VFAHLDAFAGDPILGLNEAFHKDSRPNKVNLSIGIYFDNNGHVPLLGSVREAEAQLLAEAAPKPYLPMEGNETTVAGIKDLLFGKQHEALREDRVATVQTIGSSGGIKLAAEFLKRWFPQSSAWVSDPTWENHRAIFEGSGIAVDTYPYYDAHTGGLRFDDMRVKLAQLPGRSVVVLHGCCHNPTGADLSVAQWDELIPLLHERGLIALVDLAYQGYGDGLEEDAYAVRQMSGAGGACLVANSFSKNMSLYGERAGALSIVAPDAAQAALALGQLKATVRRNWSNPPMHAGAIVSKVLTDPSLRAQWVPEVETMRRRILDMRVELHRLLARKLPGHDFNYLLTQRGMFSYTGLTATQVDRLREDHAIYLIRCGRLCLAGLNSANVEAAAAGIAAVML
jgi:aromatic-amino-acid transaminase